MSEETPSITIRANGSLRVKGATLIGADGKVITDKETYSLCRCGCSKDKPFCDGSHRDCEFDDPGVHALVE